MAQNYTSENIRVLDELSAVRLRPGMYIGSTGQRGLHHLLWEIVDNAIDEASNDFATEVSVTLHRDGSASVWDNGRGVPADPHPVLKISGIEVIYTKLHAGGKFDHQNYSYSGGLHGVGASVVNALSKWMVVESFRDWTHWRMRFETVRDKTTGKVLPGHPVTGLERVASVGRDDQFAGDPQRMRALQRRQDDAVEAGVVRQAETRVGAGDLGKEGEAGMRRPGAVVVQEGGAALARQAGETVHAVRQDGLLHLVERRAGETVAARIVCA